MIINYSKDFVWWYALNDNKPDWDCFIRFKENMENRKLNINFIDFKHIQFVSNEYFKITFIELNHNNEILYYVVKSCDFITNKGYVYTAELDNWTTYILPFLKNLIDMDRMVFAQRSFYDDDDSLIQFKDSLLEDLPKQYITKDFIYSDPKYITINGIKYYITHTNKIYLSADAKSNNVYAVFNDDIFHGESLTDTPKYVAIPYIYSTTQTTIYNDNDKTIKNYNNDELAIYTLRSGKYSNKFIGLYILPAITSFSNIKYDETENNIYIEIEERPHNNLLFLPNEIINIIGFKYILPDRFNSTSLTCAYTYRYNKTFYYDTALELSCLELQNYGNLGWVIPFIGTFGISYTMLLPYNYLDREDCVVEMPLILPTIIDEYINYCRGTIMRSTAAYKNNYDKSVANGFFGAASGITKIVAGSFGLASGLSRSPLSIITNGGNFKGFGGGNLQIGDPTKMLIGGYSIAQGAIQTASSITNAVIDVNNMARSIKAEYESKSATTGNSISSQSGSFKWYSKNKKDELGEIREKYFQYKLSPNSIKLINNTLLLYGYYTPININISELIGLARYVRGLYTYLKLDVDLTLRNNTDLLDKIPKILLEEIYAELNAGFRLIKDYSGYMEFINGK